MITKDYFEKEFKKHGKVSVYSADSIPPALTQEPCIRCDSGKLADFSIDCSDLAEYCNLSGLVLKPVDKIQGGFYDE